MKALLLLASRHGLRASEVCDLQWHQVDLTAGRLHVQAAMSYGLLAASNVSSRRAPMYSVRSAGGQ